jgi:hypothetical protein
MNNAKVGFFPLIFLLFLFSCASTQEIKRPPAFRFVDLSLSKAVEDQTSIAVPKNPTTIFSPKDPEVVAFLKLDSIGISFFSIGVPEGQPDAKNSLF